MVNCKMFAKTSGYCMLMLFVLSNVGYIFAAKEKIVSGDCRDLFAQSFAEKGGAPTWLFGDKKPICSICNSANTLRSWFYTNYVKHNTSKRIHVDIAISLSACTQCKNQYIKLYVVYEDLIGIMDVDMLIGKVEALPLIKKIEPRNVPLNKQIIYHVEFEPQTGYQGLSLVVLSEGACMIIYNITMKSFYCKETAEKAVYLPKTTSPGTGATRVNAACVKNTASDGQKVYGMCSSNGTWFVDSPCFCKKGFDLGASGCQVCQANTYKDHIGNDNCVPCPENSHSSRNAQRCTCDADHFRFRGQNYTFSCYGIPTAVKDIEVLKKTDTLVVIVWKSPPTTAGLQTFVDIQCFKCKGSSCTSQCQKVTYQPSQFNITLSNVTVGNLEPNTKYFFQLSSKNTNSYHIDQQNWVVASKKVDTAASSSASASTDIPIIVVVVVPVVVIILIVVIIVLIILLKRRKIGRRFTMMRKQRKPTEGAFPLMGEKNYIDPTTYDDPERAVSEFAKELNQEQIEFISVIGGGEFGDVYKGTLRRPGEPVTNVAIKTLKAGSTHKNRKDFLIEASIMGQFKNLNVVSLEGVVTKTIPLMIVTEFMENGSLDDYLKSNDGALKPLQLLGMARGVASGMAYLAGMHFVHRDLAARNILVNINLACKVADFGLSRDVGDNQESEYETQGGRIPVRWTAPEAIRHRKFSTASDVWSYGILLWEIMSFAERPYWEWGNLEVIERVETGYRLPPPMNCPKSVHGLMMECWTEERTHRPAFNDIVRILDEWIRNPEKLNKEHIKAKRGEPLDFTSFKTVEEWLDAFKMGMYASNFTKAGYHSLDEVAGLSENELLSKVGVRLVGHRHKIYQQIKEMNEHLQLAREQSVRI